MRKKTGRFVFYIVYCILALIGLLTDLGVFSGRINMNGLVYYTSLSNLACTVFMFISLAKNAKAGKNNYFFAPLCKYAFVVMILVTAIIYNLLLNPYRSWLGYFANIKNGLYHLILPVMFFLDWLLFYRRGTVKLWYPILATVIPFFYVLYILTRAAVVKSTGAAVAVLYPYFFLNVDHLGWQGFLTWMGVLFVALVLLGYALYALDRLLDRKTAMQKI